MPEASDGQGGEKARARSACLSRIWGISVFGFHFLFVGLEVVRLREYVMNKVLSRKGMWVLMAREGDQGHRFPGRDRDRCH